MSSCTAFPSVPDKLNDLDLAATSLGQLALVPTRETQHELSRVVATPIVDDEDFIAATRDTFGQHDRLIRVQPLVRLEKGDCLAQHGRYPLCLVVSRHDDSQLDCCGIVDERWQGL